MKKTFINQTHIEGYVYDHKLEARVSGENSKAPGTPFIMGTVDIATDNALTNIVSVHFTYVTATTAKGSANATYTVLKDIVDGKHATIMNGGKDNAVKVRIDSAIGLNEFYTDRNGVTELVSAKRNEGGFVHIMNEPLNEDENQRNTFKTDMVITGVTRVEPNEERKIKEHALVKGCIFDFRGAALPVEFTAFNAGAIDYFEGLEASNKNPIFTCLWGKQISNTTTKTFTDESAWGEDNVRTVTSTRKDWVITGSAKELYSYGTDEDCDMTASFLKKASEDRETYLATVKKRQDDYKASKSAPAAAAPASGGFNF